MCVCVCVCVCLSVCLSVREDISETTHTIVTKFLCTLSVALARSSTGVVAICYVLPVLWVFFHNGPYRPNDMNFATKERFRINLLIYHKIGQNSIILLLKDIILTNYFEITNKLK